MVLKNSLLLKGGCMKATESILDLRADIEVDEKIATPIKFYTDPEEIKEDLTLLHEEKIKLLENWLDDIFLKQIAEDESMVVAGEPVEDLTARVQKTLRTLRKRMP
jgi:hypothetical protein